VSIIHGEDIQLTDLDTDGLDWWVGAVVEVRWDKKEHNAVHAVEHFTSLPPTMTLLSKLTLPISYSLTGARLPLGNYKQPDKWVRVKESEQLAEWDGVELPAHHILNHLTWLSSSVAHSTYYDSTSACTPSVPCANSSHRCVHHLWPFVR
jgi:hypothetical protein